MRLEYYDLYGNLTWSQDERGFIKNFVYDTPTGGLLQRTDDVEVTPDSGAPDGWFTPPGGGLNLVTDYEVDNQGRETRELDPEHSVDIGGTATMVRTATFTVYDDPNHTVRIGQGYATGTGPDYAYTLVNPVEIQIMDYDGKPTDNILATKASTSGPLLPADTFAQSQYVRWQTYTYTDCCLLESKQLYRLIPATGAGYPVTNFDQTAFGYDVMKRRVQVTTPGGTISFTAFDIRDLPVTLSIGTDNATGLGNNMVIVAAYVYDDGANGGDGNLTQITQAVDDTTSRVTNSQYDWRDRLHETDGEVDFCEQRWYDNLDRVYEIDRYDTTISGHLIGQLGIKYDDLSRVYQTINPGIDPTTGLPGLYPLVDNTWYDPAGNVAKTLPSGAQLWIKTSFDGLNRPTVAYTGSGTDAAYSDIFSVEGDVILTQTELAYDADSNVIQTTKRERYHNMPAIYTGELGNPDSTPPTPPPPKARVTYVAYFPDPVGRPQARADYGTNGGTALTPPSTVPARSDTVLVLSLTYDSSGNVYQTTDPAGTVNQFAYDAAGRRITVIENVPSGSSSSSGSSIPGGCSPSADTNRTTNLTYSPDGLLSSLQAVNGSTGNQPTTYNWGTTLDDSDIASSLLLRSVAYPDSVSGSDQVWLTYNRQRQRTSLTDQNGSVHDYVYDLLGRLTEDCVTTLGLGVDATVQRIERAYEVRGMVNRVTSFNSPIVGSGSVVNEVVWTFNSFRQSIKTYQSHAGAVNTSTTASVQMSYANGSANTVRPTALTYPNGRSVAYNYGTSGGIPDLASQIASLIDSDMAATHLADFSYLGLGTVVQQNSTQANLQNTLVSLTGTNDPVTGDIYTGLDLFSRVKDNRWLNTVSGIDLSRTLYGYNRDSSRLWRANPTAPSSNYDWLYGYDGLQRVENGTRGTLNGAQTAITSPQFAQCWNLDSTGNWLGFQQDDTGGGTWTNVQSRTSNTVNEIVQITDSATSLAATPLYDANGNMTALPVMGPPDLDWATMTTDEWAALTVDQWAGLLVGPGNPATFDAWNRLMSVGNGATNEIVQQNQYDGRNYRTVIENYTDGELSETRHVYYTDDWQDVEERLGTSPDTATPDRQFVWGIQYIDGLICRDRSTTGTLNERFYACQDANWNVTAIVDTTGAVQERYEYDPYGNCTFLSPSFSVLSASVYAWETLYAGYRYESGTALYVAKNRYYLSLFGNWLTRDPIRYLSGMNLYEYVNSDVVDAVDPFGVSKIRIITKIGNVIVKVKDVPEELARRILRNKAKKPVVSGATQPRTFVQCPPKGKQNTAKRLAEDVSPTGDAVQHGQNAAGHPGHYHPVSGESGTGRPITSGTPHIGTEYTGSAMIVGAAGAGNYDALQDALYETVDIIIEMTPVGDIRTIIVQGPELISTTAELLSILESEGVRAANLQVQQITLGIDRFVGDSNPQVQSMPSYVQPPLKAGDWRKPGFGLSN